jgi:hypothetical protein
MRGRGNRIYVESLLERGVIDNDLNCEAKVSRSRGIASHSTRFLDSIPFIIIFSDIARMMFACGELILT